MHQKVQKMEMHNFWQCNKQQHVVVHYRALKHMCWSCGALVCWVAIMPTQATSSVAMHALQGHIPLERLATSTSIFFRTLQGHFKAILGFANVNNVLNIPARSK